MSVNRKRSRKAVLMAAALILLSWCVKLPAAAEELKTFEITVEMKGYRELDFSRQDAWLVREAPARSIVRDHIREGEHLVYELTRKSGYIIRNEILQIVPNDPACVLEVICEEASSESVIDRFTTDRRDAVCISLFKRGLPLYRLHIISLSGESGFTIYRVCSDVPVDITGLDAVTDCFAGVYEVLNYRLTCGESGMYRLATNEPENYMFSVFDRWDNRVIGSTIPGETDRLSLPFGQDENGALNVWLEKGRSYRIAVAATKEPGRMRFEMKRYSPEKQERTDQSLFSDPFPQQGEKVCVGEAIPEGVYLLSGGQIQQEIGSAKVCGLSKLNEAMPYEVRGIRQGDVTFSLYIPVLEYYVLREGTAYLLDNAHFVWYKGREKME